MFTEFLKLGSDSLNAGESFSMNMDVSFDDLRVQLSWVTAAPRCAVVRKSLNPGEGLCVILPVLCLDGTACGSSSALNCAE